MSSSQGCRVSTRPRDNFVGTIVKRVGVGGVCLASMVLAGCGARSGLLGASLDEGPSCPAPSATPSIRRVGVGGVSAVAVDHAGYPILAGGATGTLDLGGATVAVPYDPQGAVFLAKLGPSGCAPFARTFTPSQPVAHPLVWSMALAVADDDAILLTVMHESPIDFGGGPLGVNPSGPTGGNASVARFTAAGEHVFSRGLTASVGIGIARPASDAEGNVFIAGLFAGTLALDGTPLGTAGPESMDAFIAKLDPAGALLWSKILPYSVLTSPIQSYLSSSFSLATWPDGSLAVSGTVDAIDEVLDLGGGPLVTPGSTVYVPWGFVSRFDASGKPLWQHRLDTTVTDTRVDASGALGVIGAPVTGGDAQGLSLVRFDAAGATIGQSALSSDGAPLSTTFNAHGDVLGAGVDGSSIVVTEGNPSGQALWSRTLANVGGQPYVFPALTPAGTPMLVGEFQGTIDLGTGPLTAIPDPTGAAAQNFFVAVLQP